MTATEITEAAPPAVRWPLADGHRLRATLGAYGITWSLVCPHGTPTVGSIGNAPECRIKHNDQGEPIGLYPTCLLLDGWEGPDDSLHPIAGGGVETTIADFPIAWQWPLEDWLHVYPVAPDPAGPLNPDRIRYAGLSPIRLRDVALQLLGERDAADDERDRARRTAVALEQQVDLLTKLIGHTAAVMAHNGQPGAATELTRRAEAITDPDATEDPAAFLDRLDAELADIGMTDDAYPPLGVTPTSRQAGWRPLDAPSPYPATGRRPSRCPDDEVVDPEATA